MERASPPCVIDILLTSFPRQMLRIHTALVTFAAGVRGLCAGEWRIAMRQNAHEAMRSNMFTVVVRAAVSLRVFPKWERQTLVTLKSNMSL